MSNVIKVGNLQITNKSPVDVKAMVTELNDVWSNLLVPKMKIAQTVLGNNEFQNETITNINNYIINNIKTARPEINFAETIYNVTTKFNLGKFLSVFSKRFENGIDTDSITLQDIAYIQTFNNISLFSDYATNVLLYVLIIEQQVDTSEQSDVLNPIRVSFVNDYLGTFTNIANILVKGENNVIKTCNEVDDTYASKVGELSSGIIDINPEIVGTIAMVVTTAGAIVAGVATLVGFIKWRISGGSALVVAKKIQKNKDTKQALELRLIRMKRLREGEHDAALDKTIEKVEARIAKLDAEIAEMERKYGQVR